MKLKKVENYYKQALAVAEMSPDAETQVGALLINSKTGAVLGSGFNGFIRGANDLNLPKTRPDKYPYMVHAETNMIYNCARHGISTDECFVFCTLSPCVNCCRALYQSGIRTVIFKDKYRDFDTQAKMQDLTWTLTDLGGFTIMELKPRE
jgi:dCMP deaminase